MAIRAKVRESFRGSAPSATWAAGSDRAQRRMDAFGRRMPWMVPLLRLVALQTTCCSTPEGVVSDTLAVLQLLPSLGL